MYTKRKAHVSMPHTASSRLKAASRGGFRTKALYGNPGTTEGRRKGGLRSIQVQHARTQASGCPSTGFQLRKTFSHPRRSALLAELIGIILGDGCVAPYQVQICFNRSKEQVHKQHICTTIMRLFALHPSVYYRHHENAGYIVVSSIALTEYLTEMGLRRYPKRIPRWILQSPRYRQACVRGLVDTDGSIFIHRYRVNGKWYEYLKLSFDNRSPMLLAEVARILKRAGLSPRIESDQKVMLDRQRDVQWYLDNIGSSNPVKLRASASRRVVPNGKATAC